MSEETTEKAIDLSERLIEELTKAHERIVELEGLLKRIHGDYPCQHDPEGDPYDNPGCLYCKLFVEIGEALQSRIMCKNLTCACNMPEPRVTNTGVTITMDTDKKANQ